MGADKQRWPSAVAFGVAKTLEISLCGLGQYCSRIIIAGSLRRKKPDVGDIEILYIPRIGEAVPEGEMLPQPDVNMADQRIANLLRLGILAKRTNVNGSEMFGEKNKLLRDVASGIPVDLFAATEENWANYLVCRTGGSQNNVDICNAAIARGWKWNPYGSGFSRGDEVHRVKSEREVFEFVGLTYREPEERL